MRGKPMTREQALAAWPRMLAAVQGGPVHPEQTGGEHESDYIAANVGPYRSLAKAAGVPLDQVLEAAAEDRLSPIAKMAEQRNPRRTPIPAPLTSEQIQERLRRNNPEFARDLERQRVQVDHQDRLQQLGPQFPAPPAPRPLNGRMFGPSALVQLWARREDPWLGGDAA